jgi:hypothetical protein
MRIAAVLAFMVWGPGGCASSEGDQTDAASAPLVGIDGSTDHADRNCHVVLRELARLRDGGSGYQTSGGSWIWSGTIDISAAASAEGLAPAVLYHVGSDPTWHLAHATPTDATAPAGYVRWGVRLDQDLLGPASPDVTTAAIEVVPLLALDGGGRLFDHNRNPGDFDNYALRWDRDFAIGRADAVCPAVTPVGPARLVFSGDFAETQIGGIVPGGEVRVEYDVARLPTCRHTRNGWQLWDIRAHLRWEPSGEVVGASVGAGAATFSVPTGARRAVLWFENTSADGCQAWDSNFGANYEFDVLAPPAWVGNPMRRISRDTSDSCTGGGGIDGFNFDTWARQRAAITNACLQIWQPGITDVDGVEVWRALDVSVRWRGRGTSDAFRTEPAMFDRRIGDDARFTFNLRSIDPFRIYHCPDVPTEPAADPQYIRAEIELYFVVNGVELRSVNGVPFSGAYEDYASEPFRDASCP